MALKCTICGKEAVAEFKPFCSKRCADVDLHRWLSGSYVVAGQDGDAGSHDGEVVNPIKVED